MPFTYPVFLEVQAQRCVVIGGGPETVQKTRPLLEQGALVTVVTPDLPPGLPELAAAFPETAVVHVRDYAEGDLAGAFLCIAATGDSPLNARIFAEARREGVLMNAVDDSPHCQFATPAQVRRGDLVIAIGTGGRAPALASRVRRELGERYGAEYCETTALVGEVRDETRGRWGTFEGWAQRWRASLDDEVIDLVRDGRTGEARDLLRQRVLAPGPEPGAPTAVAV